MADEGTRRARTWSVENKPRLDPRTKTLLIATGPESRASARLPGARASRDDTRLPFPARMDARLRRVNKEIAGAARGVDK
jgi:hypothetical protein